MTKFSHPKTDVVISAKDRQAVSNAIWQWIIATEHLQSVVSSVPSATVALSISAMTQIASSEQQVILGKLPGYLRRLKEKSEKEKSKRRLAIENAARKWLTKKQNEENT